MFRHYWVLPAAMVLSAAAGAQVTAAKASTPLATLQQNAAAGNAEAEVKLGLALMKTRKPADESAAVEWFRKAATQGNTDGEFNLGTAYATGSGVTRDVPTGLKWMRESLSDGSGMHMLVYGMMLATLGGGTQQDALKWIRKSAEAGSPAGMMFLAMAEQKKNPGDARRWMLKSAQAGNPLTEMLFGWGEIHGGGMFGSPDVSTGMHWLGKSARQGYAPAEGALGLLLITGEQHVAKDPTEGVHWAEKAAAAHDAYGYYALGCAYQTGSGEPVDPAKAWYNFAAAQRVDIKHELKNTSNQMSLAATKLSPTQIQNLQAEVALIPEPARNTGMINMSNHSDPGGR